MKTLGTLGDHRFNVSVPLQIVLKDNTQNRLCDSTLSRSTLLMVSAGGLTIRRKKETVNSVHFFEFKLMTLAHDHLFTSFSASWVVELSSAGVISRRQSSSTYFQFEKGDCSWRSSIITRKKIGPNLVPCGTPAVTLSHRDTSRRSFTH